MSDSAISTQSLTKKFGNFTAVENVSLELASGVVYGLLGPNGAGKTTTMRVLSTILRPTSGTAVVGGHNVLQEPEKVRETLGVLPEDTGLYDRLTAVETLRFYGRVRGVDGKVLEDRINRLLQMFDLHERSNDRTAKYPRGMRQKLALARALIHDPPLLLLDEPTLGLDVMSTRAIRDYVKNVEIEGKTVLLNTNNMYEAQLLCTHLTIISDGKIRASGTVESLEEIAKTKGLEEGFIKLVRGETNVAA